MLQESLLNEALHVATEKKDTVTILDFCFRLGAIYKKDKDNDKIDNLIKIIKQFASYGSNADIYYNLTRLYDKSNQQDSVAKYALLGVETAIKENIKWQEYSLTRVYADYLNQSEQSQKALDVLRNIENKYPIDGEIQEGSEK